MVKVKLKLVIVFSLAMVTSLSAEPKPFSKEGRPRKVVVGTAMSTFSGDLLQRVEQAVGLFDQAASDAAARGKKLDLMVFPESALQSGRNGPAADKAVSQADPLLNALREKAVEHRSYVVLPLFLAEDDGSVSNAAVLLDREGQVAGIYRKLFPVVHGDGTLERGVRPGTEAAVFDCDFGRVGMQICWDMSYPEGWESLARQGAELVILPSASPQIARPSAYALLGRYYVINSTPRDNVTVISPIGTVMAQRTNPGVLVQEIDLSYAIVHWAPQLDNGRLFTRTYGDRAGFHYSSREDTGIFWSNDPETPIGSMLEELQLHEMDHFIRLSRELRAGQVGEFASGWPLKP